MRITSSDPWEPKIYIQLNYDSYSKLKLVTSLYTTKNYIQNGQAKLLQ